jgi:APA family basic amino acid/polyamine antiporter
LNALLFVLLSYCGYEDAIIPAGEAKDPRQTAPCALGAGIVVCVVVYRLLQFVTVTTIGTTTTDRPLAKLAPGLIGHSGALFVGIVATLSGCGYISADTLNAQPAGLVVCDARRFSGDSGQLQSRFNTPGHSILLCALMTWALR